MKDQETELEEKQNNTQDKPTPEQTSNKEGHEEPITEQTLLTTQETPVAESLVNEQPRAKGIGTGFWIGTTVIFALALVALILPMSIKSDASSSTVATVNGTSISKDKLYDELAKQGGAQTLDTLITNELIRQEMTKANLTISDADINKEMEKVKKGFNSEDELNAALAQAGMTTETLRQQVVKQLELTKLLSVKVSVTDDEVKQMFEQNKASMDTPEQVRASHILVKTKEEADAIVKQLKEGADFAALAKEKSSDGSKDKGGDLGFFGAGAMVPEFEKAAFALKTGEVSEPVKSQFGYHVIKTTDRKAAHTATFEEKKGDIKDALIAQKVSQLYPSWIEELKSKATITNSLEKKAATPTEGESHS
ncbi:peptidylprolyl isomerase [Paenibacillus sp. ACRRX]|uniref:foldase protein PrsA n=1 Tax=unclassified Paenibacillus TaxID=185978 RepID=UPI001EF59F90|nr:peptidylprolyl isomerase [Paenibacillus sp. UMB4589-SE434]MCG7409787.1 peptidylprolyl isomerase [Paenibacillus sp. ACRRX]MDK8182229.1 peptidylprolyl isomerase [Paenibacillus sp. UMB4589-SE434]